MRHYCTHCLVGWWDLDWSSPCWVCDRPTAGTADLRHLTKPSADLQPHRRTENQ